MPTSLGTNALSCTKSDIQRIYFSEILCFRVLVAKNSFQNGLIIEKINLHFSSGQLPAAGIRQLAKTSEQHFLLFYFPAFFSSKSTRLLAAFRLSKLSGNSQWSMYSL